jgi:two-component system chemotaxis response regulator CheB
MARRDMVVVDASTGGVEALTNLVRTVPGDRRAAPFVGLHLPAQSPSLPPRSLSRTGNLPAHHAEDGEAVEPGCIYMAPPDHHLLVRRGQVRLSRGPRESSRRPALDVLFRSAAYAFGRRVIGVILSGTLDDGTAGLATIRRLGSIAIVQDPDEALLPGMRRNALEFAGADYMLPVTEIDALLRRLVVTWVSVSQAEAEDVTEEVSGQEPGAAQREPQGAEHASGFVRPEPGGALFELPDGPAVRFRYRLGHTYLPGTLLSEQHRPVEAALWTTRRTLEERAALADRLVERSRRNGHRHTVARFQKQAADARTHVATIHQVLRGWHDADAESV